MKESDRWLTSFVCELGQFQWVRTPFGMSNSGTTFVGAIQIALQKTRSFTKLYVDDMAIHSDYWSQQLADIETYLNTMREFGFTHGVQICFYVSQLLTPVV